MRVIKWRVTASTDLSVRLGDLTDLLRYIIRSSQFDPKNVLKR